MEFCDIACYMHKLLLMFLGNDDVFPWWIHRSDIIRLLANRQRRGPRRLHVCLLRFGNSLRGYQVRQRSCAQDFWHLQDTASCIKFTNHWVNYRGWASWVFGWGKTRGKHPGAVRGVFATSTTSKCTGSYVVVPSGSSTMRCMFFQDSVRSVETSMFSLGHLLLTSLHLVQVTLAYFLMLIVMTYNTWLCLAVVIGATVGYFLFGWRKNAIVDVSDHCH